MEIQAAGLTLGLLWPQAVPTAVPSGPRRTVTSNCNPEEVLPLLGFFDQVFIVSRQGAGVLQLEGCPGVALLLSLNQTKASKVSTRSGRFLHH